MIAACDEAKVKLAVIFQRRTSPMWHKVKKTVEAGKLGKMVLGDAYLKYFRSQEYYDSGDWRGTWELDGGGALMNQGVHMHRPAAVDNGAGQDDLRQGRPPRAQYRGRGYLPAR